MFYAPNDVRKPVNKQPQDFLKNINCNTDHAMHLIREVFKKKFGIPTITPSSVVTVIPTGAKTSLSFPLSPLSDRTLWINKMHTNTCLATVIQNV